VTRTPLRRRAWVEAVEVVTALVVAALVCRFEAETRPLWVAVVDSLVGAAFVLTSVVARRRRAADRSADLMLIVGFTWYLGNLADVGALARFAFWARQWNKYWLVALLLSYPTGVLRRRVERLGLAAAAVMVFGFHALVTLAFDPRAYFGYEGPFPGPVLVSDRHTFDVLVNVENACFFVLTTLLGTLLLQRWRASSRATRRTLLPLWVAGLLTVTSFFASQALVPLHVSDRVFQTVDGATLVAQLLIPVAFLLGLLRASRARVVVADLVVALERPTDAAGLRALLADALGDPGLDIGFWAGERGEYVHADGAAFATDALPADRAATPVGGGSTPLAVLVHDKELLAQASLLRSVGAAAGMSLANLQLQAELRAQLRELRESRARMAEATLLERRRVERDLHDGAQQRLLALGLTLSMIRDRVGATEDPALESLLAEATAETRAAVAELRDLARGIHPAVLTEEGLGAAVTTLAARAALPVSVSVAPRRWPPVLEATAYFVIAEALTNAQKHAHATHVTVDVRQDGGVLVVDVADDGIGGARVTAGSGLGGLTDRVQAVGGSLVVGAREPHGTRVHVELPAP